MPFSGLRQQSQQQHSDVPSAEPSSEGEGRGSVKVTSSTQQQKQRRRQQRFRLFRSSSFSWLLIMFVGCMTFGHIYKCSTIFQRMGKNRNLYYDDIGQQPDRRNKQQRQQQQEQQHWEKLLVEDDLIRDICTGPLRRQLVTNLTSSLLMNKQSKHNDVNGDDYNWVIMMTINDGYFDFFQNWYLHYVELNLNLDIALFAEDRAVYYKLMTLNLTQVSVIMTDTANSMPKETTEALDFGNAEYEKLVSYRPSRLLNLLCSTGRNVLYVDVDTLWLKNPLPYLQPQQSPNKEQGQGSNVDNTNKIIVETPLSYRLKTRTDPDLFIEDHQSDITMTVDKFDNLCTAFMAIRVNRRTIKFVSNWEQEILEKPKIDQYAFNGVYKHMYLSNDEDLIALNGLPQRFFPSGQQYFNNKRRDKQEDYVVQVHANWIIGHGNKRAQLIKHNLWKVKDLKT